jgi:hypothetical protein
MVDLTKFTSTKKADFEQLARDRKKDFEALRRQKRWTASVYIGPYVIEAQLKAKICERLDVDALPAVFKIHDLIALTIYAGLTKSLESEPKVLTNLKAINAFHKEAGWRYTLANPAHQADSNNMAKWLFHHQNGVSKWLEQLLRNA